jgi:hypothetical protein
MVFAPNHFCGSQRQTAGRRACPDIPGEAPATAPIGSGGGRWTASAARRSGLCGDRAHHCRRASHGLHSSQLEGKAGRDCPVVRHTVARLRALHKNGPAIVFRRLRA